MSDDKKAAAPEPKQEKAKTFDSPTSNDVGKQTKTKSSK